MNGTPLVSIGLPVFNGADHIGEALDSLLAQDFTDFELLISDNASEDGTRGICAQYAGDPRVRYHRNQVNLGSVANFNRLFELARGRYFMWAGHHDIWGTSYVRRCVEMLEDDPTAVLCSAQPTWIDGQGRLLMARREKTMLADGPTPQARVAVVLRRMGYGEAIYGLIRASALAETRLFRNVYGTDLVLLAELAALGKLLVVPEPLLFQRNLARPGDDDVAIRWKKLHPANRQGPRLVELGIYRELIRAIGRLPLPIGRRLLMILDALDVTRRSPLVWLELEFAVRRVLKRILPRGAILGLKRLRGTPRSLRRGRGEAAV